MASFSDYAEKKILDAVTTKAAFPTYTNLYLALCTTVPVDADTGSTIVEANYTGYARKVIVAADWNAASGTTATAVTNAIETFAACTAGSSVVIGWALCDAATVGNVWMWGTCTSITISVTVTPATVAAGALSLGLD